MCERVHYWPEVGRGPNSPAAVVSGADVLVQWNFDLVISEVFREKFKKIVVLYQCS